MPLQKLRAHEARCYDESRVDTEGKRGTLLGFPSPKDGKWNLPSG
jgi:hypothetical protein